MSVRVDFVVYVDDVAVADGSSGDCTTIREAAHFASSELHNFDLSEFTDQMMGGE